MRISVTLLTIGMLAPAALGAPVVEESTSRGPVDSVFNFLNQMAEPAPLSLAHAQFDNSNSCNECHTVTQGVPDTSCLACHTLVGERLETAAGWHGQAEGHCITCHTDHEGRDFNMMEFDMPAFNHDRAVWRLEGAHRDLECAQCHVDQVNLEDNVGWQFLGMSQDCASCHSDPHESTMGESCAMCHTPTAWDETHLFDHETMTDFPLANLHAGLDCNSCHTNMNDEESTPIFQMANGGDCASCHTEIESIFSGERFTEALDETIPDVHHGEIDCQSCHSVEDLSPHLSLIAARCTECHTPAHGQQIFETARLIEESLQQSPRDMEGRLTQPPFAGLGGSDLIHNPSAWLSTADGLLSNE